MHYGFIDFETRSSFKIQDVGSSKYTKSPDFKVLLSAHAVGDNPVAVRDVMKRDPLPLPVANPDVTWVAWNAAFENAVFARLGVKTRAVCAAAWARRFGLPGSLDQAAFFLFNERLKMAEGRKLIRKYCEKPFSDDFESDDWKLFKKYCKNDVELLRKILKELPPMTNEFIRDYRMSEEINTTGIQVDSRFATLSHQRLTFELSKISETVMNVTGLPVSRGARVTKWVYRNLPGELKPLMETDTGKLSLQKSVREDILPRISVFESVSYDPQVQSDVTKVVTAVGELAVPSTVKYATMLKRMESDHRVRDSFVLYGANTGRFSVRGLQLQNLPREEFSVEQIAKVKKLIYEFADVKEETNIDLVRWLKSSIRSGLVPRDGHKFIGADWSQIEGRMSPWLSKSEVGREKLALFDADIGPYRTTAGNILGKRPENVTKKERLVFGKIPELALGYGGGPDALTRTAGSFGVSLSRYDAKRVVGRWRCANAWATVFWNELSRAVYRAYYNPGKYSRAGKLAYMYVPTMLGGSLLCELPCSKRWICYPGFRSFDHSFRYKKAAIRPKATAESWPEVRIWHGMLLENAAQAAAADVLIRALHMLSSAFERERMESRVVLHVHDEILVEAPEREVDRARSILEEIMNKSYSTLPLKCESWVGEFYRK